MWLSLDASAFRPPEKRLTSSITKNGVKRERYGRQNT